MGRWRGLVRLRGTAPVGVTGAAAAARINRFAVYSADIIIRCGMPESKKKPRLRPLFLKKTVRKS